MRWYLIICCSIFLYALDAQDEVVNYSKDNGLTSNEITFTLVDTIGIVWVGTNKGLNAWTGKQWFNINQINDDASGMITVDHVVAIFEDSKGFIWVSTEKGLFLYNREYWITFVSGDQAIDYVVKYFYEDSSSRLWTFLEYYQDLSEELNIILTGGTIHMFNGSNWFEFDSDVAGTSGTKFTGESTRYFTDYLEARNGILWVSTLDGLFSFDGIKWIEHIEKEINAVKTYSVLEDINQDIWIASENGVSRYNDGNWVNYNRKNGLSNSFFHKLKIDPSGRIWAFVNSDFTFGGLNMFNGAEWKVFSGKKMHLKGTVEEVLFTGNEVIAYSENGITAYIGGQWNSFNRESGLKDKKLNYIKKDRFGTIWLAGNSRLYNYNGKQWNTIFQPEDDWEVVTIFVDGLKTCWIGTKKDGIYRLGKDGSWVHYSESNGLASNSVKDIFEDRTGNTWVVTKRGISKIPK